jgi:DNA-binding response OmpR family regulator
MGNGKGHGMAAARSILIVEAEPVVRAALADALGQDAGVAVTGCAGLAAAETFLAEERGDLLILSVADTGEDALAFYRRARCEDSRMAVMLLVPSADGAALESALAAGVDDVLGKPFRLGLLLARVRRLLRDLPDLDEEPVAVGPWLFHPMQRVLLDGARRVRLTEKEAAILLHLHRAAAPVERQVLLNEVWGYNDQVTTHTLETHIYKLRQKIEANPSDAALLLTEGGGYRLA